MIKTSWIQWAAKQTDERLLAGADKLVENDRKRKALFLICLNEIDGRKLYAEKGCSSLFKFLVERYAMSESSALKKIQAARLARVYPFLYRDIAEGKYSLSVLGRLAPFVNSKNAHLLFGFSVGKSVREVENYLVTLFPKEDVEDRLQKKISPLGMDRVHIQFTADQEFVSDLKEAQDLLSHRFPQGKYRDVIGLALKTLNRELKKSGKVRPAVKDLAVEAKPTPVPATRYIPRGIRRQVWAADAGRCQHRKEDGTLCGETRFLEVDHVQPFALGGRSDAGNLRLLCWAHNAWRAQKTFGRGARSP